LTFCTRPEEFHSAIKQTRLFILSVYDDKALPLSSDELTYSDKSYVQKANLFVFWHGGK